MGERCILCGAGENKKFVLDYLKCGQCGLAWSSSLRKQNPKPWRHQDFLGYFKMRDYYNLLFTKIIAVIEKYKKGGRLLDIGSSVGVLLKIAKKRGWKVAGVERSNWAAKYSQKALGIPVFVGRFEDVILQTNYFDVVVANHVLEHLPKPLKSLKKIYQILKPEGILFISVPNIESIMFLILGKNWPGLQPGEHIWQFEKNTLKKLVEMAEFKVIKLWSESGFTPSAGWLKRLKEIILWFFDKIGRGESLMLIATKGD